MERTGLYYGKIRSNLKMHFNLLLIVGLIKRPLKNSNIAYQISAFTSQITTPTILINWPPNSFFGVTSAFSQVMLLKSSETLLGILRRRGLLSFMECFGGCLMSHMYENPTRSEVDLLTRILSPCVHIQKYARYIWTGTQQTLCVTCRIIILTGSQFESYCKLFENVTNEINNNREIR